MAENIRENEPPEPPRKPREVPKPTERSTRSEATAQSPESQQSALERARHAAPLELAKARHFDSVAPGYDRVNRADLPADWMRNRAQDFTPRPEGTNRPTDGAYRYRDDNSPGPTAVSSSPRDRSVGSDLDYSRLNSSLGTPLRAEPANAGDAEMRAAKQMREDARSRLAEEERGQGMTPAPREPRHMDVVLDNSTCGSREFDQDKPLTCDRLLPGVMPAGDTMTVYGSVDGGRNFFRKTFTGTGELIR